MNINIVGSTCAYAGTLNPVRLGLFLGNSDKEYYEEHNDVDDTQHSYVGFSLRKSMKNCKNKDTVIHYEKLVKE